MADLQAEPAIFHREVTVGFGRELAIRRSDGMAAGPRCPLLNFILDQQRRSRRYSLQGLSYNRRPEANKYAIRFT